eukprot:3637790-Rhodomonas_salina.2
MFCGIAMRYSPADLHARNRDRDARALTSMRKRLGSVRGRATEAEAHPRLCPRILASHPRSLVPAFRGMPRAPRSSVLMLLEAERLALCSQAR